MKTGNNILSARELEVLKLLMQGFSHKVIAGELKISIDTVRTHMRHLHTKSGRSSGPELIRWAHDHGFHYE
jgi:DNA-binding NarL/FixJ family response regulator